MFKVKLGSQKQYVRIVYFMLCVDRTAQRQMEMKVEG
jgi:hypothetical protein